VFLSVRAGIKGRLCFFVLQKYIQLPLSFAPPGREGGADIGGRLDVLRQTGNGKRGRGCYLVRWNGPGKKLKSSERKF